MPALLNAAAEGTDYTRRLHGALAEPPAGVHGSVGKETVQETRTARGFQEVLTAPT
jgi:hypothetical protein